MACMVCMQVCVRGVCLSQQELHGFTVHLVFLKLCSSCTRIIDLIYHLSDCREKTRKKGKHTHTAILSSYSGLLLCVKTCAVSETVDKVLESKARHIIQTGYQSHQTIINFNCVPFNSHYTVKYFAFTSPS